jgi:RNA polymerase sigma-70 factor (ECF subfamily)
MPASPSPQPATDWTQKGHELADLLARTALSDRKAFARLYELTSSPLLGVILRIVRERDAAEDVLQEVYVNVWRAAQSFNASLAQPMTWLASIARNRAIDSLRRRDAEPQTVSRYADDDEDGGGDLLAGLASDAPGPMELFEQAADARALKRCVTGLTREQQQSVALAFYEGLSHAEVAEQLRQPLGTVKSWVRRGLLALKACLERAAQTDKAGAVPQQKAVS